MFSQTLAVSSHQGLVRVHVVKVRAHLHHSCQAQVALWWGLQHGVIRLYYTVLGGRAPALGVTGLQLVLGPVGAPGQVAKGEAIRSSYSEFFVEFPHYRRSWEEGSAEDQVSILSSFLEGSRV